jgi:hypothetical protein
VCVSLTAVVVFYLLGGLAHTAVDLTHWAFFGRLSQAWMFSLKVYSLVQACGASTDTVLVDDTLREAG